MSLPVILITTGDPAGIGPDICLRLASHPFPARLLVVGDIDCLRDRAAATNLNVNLFSATTENVPPHQLNQLAVWHTPLAVKALPGKLDPHNAESILEMIDRATDACRDGHAHAMVTGPVQKSILNRPGAKFLGHTEYLATRLRCPHVVMLLVADQLRVALATTHLPLKDVPTAINGPDLLQTITVLNRDLQSRFGIHHPRIAVCGLNPHAGESGHLGYEEIETISPTIKKAQAQGIRAFGPIPADTAFTAQALADCDAILAMYHDQGLPVLKAMGFDRGVNITLGLSILRTSVDHGTALSLAGSPLADPGSLIAATQLALQCHSNR